MFRPVCAEAQSDEWDDELALTFKEDTSTNLQPVHDSIPEDPKETCAEFQQRHLEPIAKAQGWCASCLDIIARFVITEDCNRCMDDYLKRREQPYRYKKAGIESDAATPPTLPPDGDPRWWSFQDRDVKAVLDTPDIKYDSQYGISWRKLQNEDTRSAVRRFGFTESCSICFNIVQAMSCQVRRNFIVGARYAMTPLSLWNLSVCNPELPSNSVCFDFEFHIWEETKSVGFVVEYIHIGIPVVESSLATNACRHWVERFNPRYLQKCLNEEIQLAPELPVVQSKDLGTDVPPWFRLIDVDQQCIIRVSGYNIKYSAISYRWGSSCDIMLTADTESMLSKPGSLSLQTMCQTLHDCMSLARDLGIPYIWIDRYCIMQGNDSEKAEQIHAMGHIYANSWLTMICILMQPIDDGLPGYSRDMLYFPSQRWAVAVSGAAQTWTLWGYDLDEPEWLERGWTMQEEHLSPRRLYLTDYTAVWHIDCPTMSYHAKINDAGACVLKDCCTKSKSSIRRIVEQYSKRKLTDPGDRLHAISGLLTARGIEHVQGIGTGSVRVNLMWSTYNSLVRPNTNHIFPTWSWACIDGTAEWDVRHISQNQPKYLALHSKTAKTKRPRAMRIMRLSSDAVAKLDDRHMVLHARSKFVDESGDIYWDVNPERNISSRLIAIQLTRMTMYGPTDKRYLLVEPFQPSLNCVDSGIIHARRVGIFWDCLDKQQHVLWKLAHLRPLAPNGLKRLKAFRLRHACSFRRYRTTHRYSQYQSSVPLKFTTSDSASSNRSFVKKMKSRALQRQKNATQKGGGFETMRSKKRKRTALSDVSPDDVSVKRRRLGEAPIDSMCALLERARAQKVRHRRQQKPTRRPFFGSDPFKDDPTYRTIVLH